MIVRQQTPANIDDDIAFGIKAAVPAQQLAQRPTGRLQRRLIVHVNVEEGAFAGDPDQFRRAVGSIRHNGSSYSNGHGCRALLTGCQFWKF